MVGFGIVAVVTAAAFLFDRMSRQKCLRHMFKCRQTEIGLFVCGYLSIHLYKQSERAHFFCILFKVILSFLIENVHTELCRTMSSANLSFVIVVV